MVCPGSMVRHAMRLAVFVALAAAASTAPGQALRLSKPEEQADAEADNPVFAQADRTILQHLHHAQTLLEEKRFGEAVRLLGTILEGPEDYFYQPDPKRPVHRSLKGEAQRLLGEMPEEGRRLYELQFGARAKQMLAAATDEGDADQLADVSRRFFHTEAGHEATFLLGLHHLDRDQPLAAALTLARLRADRRGARAFEPTLSLALAACWARAGMRQKAQDALEDLKGTTVWIGGKQVRLSGTEDEPLAALLAAMGGGPREQGEPDRWTMRRGNPARNASVDAGAPLLSLLWRVPATDHPLAEGALEGQASHYAERGAPALPEFFPLAVDDVVLSRSLTTLVAVDFQTGKRLWEVPVDDPLDPSTESDPRVYQQPAQWASVLAQRSWRDAIFGSLASDGQRVFSVEDLGFAVAPYHAAVLLRGIRPGIDGAWPQPCNRLAAYDIRTGKLTWELGGSPAGDGLAEAGSFFLGPPLPLSDRLYQLAETRGEVRLLAIEPASGRVLWSQQIALVDRAIGQDMGRRTAAATPSYADGILVCPTVNGAIVAVEPATRSLLWGFQYARQTPRYSAAVFGMPVPRVTTMLAWTDDSLIVTEGRVLASPSDSQWLFCLNLMDGKPLWQIAPSNDLYVACVRSGKVVLVGARQVRAVNLADGEPAWDGRAIELPDESLPSGQGFASGEYYYLPTTAGAVLAIDLAQGRIARSVAARDGAVPGNLIAHRGKILSQGLSRLDAFHQSDVLKQSVDRTLAQSPDDAKALAWRGELLLDAGDRAGAVAALRRSLALDDSARARHRLRDALLDGLRDEFDAYRAVVGELETLAETPDQRVDLYRRMIDGLESRQQWRPASEFYRRLVQNGPEGVGLVPVTPHYAVRLDRWLEVRLENLRNNATDDVRAEVDRLGRSALAAAANDPATLEWIAGCFASQPIGADARAALFDRYVGQKRFLEAEQCLWRELTSDEPRTAAGAYCWMAEMLRQADRPDDAAVCYRLLAERWPDVVCRDGKTGRRIVEALAADDPVGRSLAGARLWPVGQVRVASSSPENSRENYSLFPIAFEGSREPFFLQTEAMVDTVRRKMIVRDGVGREQWTVNIAEDNGQYLAFNPTTTRLMVRGHLVLLWLGSRCMAIDALADPSRRVLWNRTLREQMNVDEEESILLMGGLGPQVFLGGIRGAAGAGSPCALSAQGLCYQPFRGCVTLDPLGGRTLWSRRRLPADGAVFGDEEYLFVAPGGSTEAIVLRAVDGAELPARRVVPPPDQHVATFGRNVLVWRPEGDRRVLEMIDPWQQRIVWGPYPFSANAKLDVADQTVVGLVEPSGRFVLIALDDGRVLTDTELAESSSQLTGIVLFSSGDQYTLVTQRQSPTAPNRMPQPLLRSVLGKPILKGEVYALSRDGKLLWPKPVKIEDQQILLNQPASLPVISFASRVLDAKQRPPRWTTSVLLIDKRTGRRILTRQYPTQTARFELVGDPAARTVSVALPREMVTLTFTDEPLGPEEEEPDDAEQKRPSVLDKLPKTTGHLLKALRAAALDEE
ncbi:MAG: PQQ-binding-like beta-propeller repeat protein [Pirellulales bacterium]|nr:PQQ-binding-like beta-propeller repeat protein [Pirellulales bacterium]